MQVLSNRDIAPPEITGGDSFRYTHRETAHRSAATDYWTWWTRIKEHRKANNLPPITQTEAESQLCDQLPPGWCHGDDPNRPHVDVRISLNEVWDVMKVFESFVVSGFNFVSQEEANRRARICIGCPNNVNLSGCGACRQMGEMLVGELAKRSTPHDPALKTCAVCKCLNKAQVHIPLDSLDAKDSPEKQALYPSFCWLKISGENFLPA